jgi:hypothetical protein
MGLAPEAAGEGRIQLDLTPDHLDGEAALEVDVHCNVYASHPAPTETAFDGVLLVDQPGAYEGLIER